MPALQDAWHILCIPAASAPYDDVLVGFQVEEPEASSVWFAGHKNKIRTICPNEKPMHATAHTNNEPFNAVPLLDTASPEAAWHAVAHNALIAFISFMWQTSPVMMEILPWPRRVQNQGFKTRP